MKRVIRLTESDLIRLVKRVIKEQVSNPKESAKKFVNSFGGVDDDEVSATQAIYELKNESDWNIFSAEVKKLSGKTVKDLFNKYMSPFNKKQYNAIVNHVLEITKNKENLGVSSTKNKIYGFLGDTGDKGPDATR